MKKWDSQKIVAELQRRHQRGKDLSQTGIKDDPIFSACFRHIGSYHRAVELAGIDYQTVWRRRFTKWNCDSIKEELRKRKRNGEDIWSRGMRVTEAPLHAAAVHWFGSYRAAVEAAGIDYGKICHCIPNTWTRETIVAEIQRLHAKAVPFIMPASNGTNRRWSWRCIAYLALSARRSRLLELTMRR